jgi:orotate phosphoribosyltransferase
VYSELPGAVTSDHGSSFVPAPLMPPQATAPTATAILLGVNSPQPAGEAASDARSELLSQIREKAIVHGRVTLSSGREADSYVDLRRITLDGAAAPLVGEVMLDLVADLRADPGFDSVGGLTLGADPVAAAMVHAAAARRGAGHDPRPLDAFVVRKEGKAHGLQRRIEGPDVAGRRVIAVEDTSTTGSSVLTAVAALREAGATVVAVAVIVDRDTGSAEAVAAAGLTYRFAYSKADLGLD